MKEYFEEYLTNDIPHDKKLLMKTLSNAENIEKFSNASFLWDKESCPSEYMRGEADSSNKFLLSDNQWSEKTLSEELSGDYGKTYLVHYLKNLNLTNK